MLNEEVKELLKVNKLVDKNNICMYGYLAASGFGGLGNMIATKNYCLALNGREVNIVPYNKKKQLDLDHKYTIGPDDSAAAYYKRIFMGQRGKKYLCIASRQHNFKFMIASDEYDVADAIVWILNGNK